MKSFLGREFFQSDPRVCARELIGHEFVFGDCAGVVVETEAYAELGDPACHTFRRPSAREFIERHEAGDAYIYLNYGMYWLLNVLVKGETNGFVLIRALEPTRGIELMRQRRGRDNIKDLCSGPGKICLAFDLDGRYHGRSLCESEERGFSFFKVATCSEVESSPRIGISMGKNLMWRFILKGSPFLSRSI